MSTLTKVYAFWLFFVCVQWPLAIYHGINWNDPDRDTQIMGATIGTTISCVIQALLPYLIYRLVRFLKKAMA